MVEKTELGESRWGDASKQIANHVVNELVKVALNCGVKLVVIERVKGLRSRVLRKIDVELKRLWEEDEESGDVEALEERRKLVKLKKILSRFPYRRLALDLKAEANWNGILVREVRP